MHDEHPHPLLSQVPLTISPFLSLPTATPLPYTYKQLPSTLPPSILSAPPQHQTSTDAASNNSSQIPNQHQNQNQNQSAAYITSPSTSASATPDAILSSCIALQTHLSQLEASARASLRAWEEKRRADELAEKRRVAPGWLDGEVRLLVPENVGVGEGGGQDTAGTGGGGLMDMDMRNDGTRPEQQPQRASVGVKAVVERRDGVPDPRAGEELDRAFGGLDIK